MNLIELEKQIPQSKPNIQIGSLSIWVLKIDVQNDNPDHIILRTPFLFQTSKVAAFSPNSQIKGFELKNLEKELMNMQANLGTEKTVMAQFEESEFSVVFKSNIQNQIELEIIYRTWGHAGYGKLEFKDSNYTPEQRYLKIDQTNLQKIINDIHAVMDKYKID
jgi:hypothetical protein